MGVGWREWIGERGLRLTLSAKSVDKASPNPLLCCDKNRASRRLARKPQGVKQHKEGKVREFVHPIRSRQLFCVEKCPFVSLFRVMYYSSRIEGQIISQK